MRSKKRWTLAKLFTVTLLAIPAMSCRTTVSNGMNDLSFCQAAKPIYWSGKDTAETIKQVKELNAVYQSGCGWK